MTTSPVADWMVPAELVRDPYAAYAQLRHESPVPWVPFLGSSVATTYDASRFVEMNPDIFIAEGGGTTVRRTMQRHSRIDVDDTFAIRRPKLTNFDFGAGVQMCAGIWAARWSIGCIAMPMRHRRFKKLHNAEDREATWSGFVTRGFQTHPVIRDKDRGEN